jgi:hypothetical protein
MNPLHQRAQLYLKKITLSRKEFLAIKRRIQERYQSQNLHSLCFDTFYSWSLVAVILGIFTGHGDSESIRLFLECVSRNTLPKIWIKPEKKQTMVCICIDFKKHNERTTQLQNSHQ